MEFYPTLLESAGIQPPQGQTPDGVSLFPFFHGASTHDRKRLFWHFPCYLGKATPSSAIREADFKLIEFFEERGRIEFFNLKSDPNEEKYIAALMPDKAAALSKTLRS